MGKRYVAIEQLQRNYALEERSQKQRREHPMSTQPRLEARVTVQERRQIALEARVEELSEDITASLDQLSVHLDKIETTMATKEDIAALATKEDLATLEARINIIETTMATKEDLATLETRILDAFKQVLAVVNPQSQPAQ